MHSKVLKGFSEELNPLITLPKVVTSSLSKGTTDMRDNLLERKVWKEKDDHYLLMQDYPFGSSSTAASAFLGRSANGRTEWKDADGKTLKEIQESDAD